VYYQVFVADAVTSDAACLGTRGGHSNHAASLCFTLLPTLEHRHQRNLQAHPTDRSAHRQHIAMAQAGTDCPTSPVLYQLAVDSQRDLYSSQYTTADRCNKECLATKVV
jgi:hypothetical protein